MMIQVREESSSHPLLNIPKDSLCQAKAVNDGRNLLMQIVVREIFSELLKTSFQRRSPQNRCRGQVQTRSW